MNPDKWSSYELARLRAVIERVAVALEKQAALPDEIKRAIQVCEKDIATQMRVYQTHSERLNDFMTLVETVYIQRSHCFVNPAVEKEEIHAKAEGFVNSGKRFANGIEIWVKEEEENA